MDSAALEVERAKAERKSPLLLWILNILWPGLGNLVIGHLLAGMIFGLAHWFFLFVLVMTQGLGGFLCFFNWIVASAMGHLWINKRYAKALEKIQAKQDSAAGSGA